MSDPSGTDQKPVAVKPAATPPEQLLGPWILEHVYPEHRPTEKTGTHRPAFESSTDGIFTIDRHYHLSGITPNIERHLGYRAEEVLNRPIGELNILATESLARALADVEKIFTGAEVAGAVYEFIAKDGTRKIGEVTGTPLVREGRIDGVTAIVRDITERRQAEEALLRSEARYRTLAEEIAAVAEIGRLIGSTLEIDQVFELFAAETGKRIPFDRIAVILHRPDREYGIVAHAAGLELPGRRQGDLFLLEGSICELLAKTRTGLLRAGADAGETDPLSGLDDGPDQAELRSRLLVPLFCGDEVVGALDFGSRKPNRYNRDHLRLAGRIGEQIAGALVHAQRYADLKKTEQELRENQQRFWELSMVDDLTQLYNSRHFHVQLKSETDRSNRYGLPLTLLLMDLDNFKAFNDAYGHVAGDQVLSRFGQVVRRCLRETDSAYRYGGEEFAVLLPMTTGTEGFVTAERIRTEFKKENFSPSPRKNLHVTVTIGLGQYRPMEEMKSFVHRVDQWMYQGKKEGRDRVRFESSPKEQLIWQYSLQFDAGPL